MTSLALALAVALILTLGLTLSLTLTLTFTLTLTLTLTLNPRPRQVGFSPCMPALALLAFALDLLMIRAVLFRAVYVQQRDRPLRAPGLGVWNR